jgi:hypothetical protein
MSVAIATAVSLVHLLLQFHFHKLRITDVLFPADAQRSTAMARSLMVKQYMNINKLRIRDKLSIICCF